MVRRVRGKEVAPGVGRVLDRLHRGGGNALLLFGKKMLVEIRFRIHARFMALIEHVERVEIGVFRIDAIRGEASAQAIAAIVHERDGLQNVASVVARARLVHDAGNGASGGNAHVAFTQAAAVKRACAGCRLLRRFSIVHAAPHFPHWPNPGNSRRGGLVATGAWRCAAPQGLGSECSVSRVWMQRFTSVTRMLQRSVMCVSKALTPQEEQQRFSMRRQEGHGDSACGDKGIAYARRGTARSVAQRRRAPPNRPLRPNGGVVTENGTMGPFCRVNNSRKAEWCATRNTFCLMGGNINFIPKFRPAKNRPHSRHSWHRNTIPMQ